MKFKAKYFDGKTSQPKEVWLKVIEDFELQLFTEEYSIVPFERWELLQLKNESFNSSKDLQLSYISDGVRRSLEIENPNQELVNYLSNKHSKEDKIFAMVLKRNSYKVIGISVTVLAVMIFVYVKWVSVFVGNTIVSIIPLAVEETIGDNAFNQMNPFLDIDTPRTRLLQEFYNALDFNSEYQVSVYLDTNKRVNAFALPGGKLVVYDGLIKKTQSWQELAALFGHELSHVNDRHSMRLLSRELGNYAVFSAITGDMAGISSVIIESAISLNELVYSRTYEKEADLNGLDMLIENDIEPEAMLRLFERLLEENKEVEEILKDLELLSTHPLTDNRMDYIKDYIESKGLLGYLGKKNEKAEMLWKKIKEK